MLHCTTPTHPGVFRQVCIDTRTLRMLLNICVCSVAACDCNLAIVLFLQFERKKATGTTQLFFLAGFRVFFYPHSYRGSYGTSAHRLDLQLLLQTQQRGCLLSSNEENKEHDVCKAGIV